jgi:hypothetical protein
MRRLILWFLLLAMLPGCKSAWSVRETRVLDGSRTGPCVEQAIRESEGVVSVERADDTGRTLNFMSECGPGTACVCPDTGNVRIEISMSGAGLGLSRRRRKRIDAFLNLLCQNIAEQCRP